MRSTSWRVLALAALAAAPLSAGQPRSASDEKWCSEDGGGWREGARHCEVREMTLPAGGTLAVDARPNGGIQVEGWDRSDVRLRVKVVATADTNDAARALAGEVRVETSDTVGASGPQNTKSRQWHASFRLDVPRGQALKLRADNGGLHLADVEGDAELSTVNGGLHLDRVAGHIVGETVNGGIHVELAGSEWQGEGLELRTTNGGLHLEIPADYNARLEASTMNGGVHSEVPAARPGKRRGGQIAADLGSGGRLLKFETTNGGLHIAER
jgi:DUF4097 and DUF4098 domain-containing protein YvlB